jgi:alpha-L-fucosidase
MTYHKILLFALAVCTVTLSSAQHAHPTSANYQWPTDPLVRQKLDQWQDLKFGMIIHWGLYAEAGIIESWSLCSEEWISRDSTADYADYKKWYWGLNKKFNPRNFNPEQWAAAARDAGMKYLVFTTKHHDGFNMFDTKQSDFKISNGPFADHPRKNVALHVFNAFRKEGFMIGAYFSKPDWHSEYYWWPKYATPDRNNNYDIRKYSWRWNEFKRFTHDQIQELMTEYGKVDILWLDGGWVRPLETVNEEVRAWGARIPEWSQDIDLEKIAVMARKNQPGLLVVDRTVHGKFENYLTPEQNIPSTKLDHPWESCITLGDAWGHVPNDQYKSSAKIIHTLAEIVAKGGSLLLGVGPGPDGTLNQTQVQRLKEIGSWLEVNGKAIYHTRTTEHFQDGKIFFTRGKNDELYAIWCLEEGAPIPAEITWRKNLPTKGTTMKLVSSGESVKWKIQEDAVIVTLPKKIQQSGKTPALVFEFVPASKK